VALFCVSSFVVRGFCCLTLFFELLTLANPPPHDSCSNEISLEAQAREGRTVVVWIYLHTEESTLWSVLRV
jgi:hypothetical protein